MVVGCGDDALPVRREGDGGYAGAFSVERCEVRARYGIPQQHVFVRRAEHDAAVGRKTDGGRPRVVRAQCDALLKVRNRVLERVARLFDDGPVGVFE